MGLREVEGKVLVQAKQCELSFLGRRRLSLPNWISPYRYTMWSEHCIAIGGINTSGADLAGLGLARICFSLECLLSFIWFDYRRIVFPSSEYASSDHYFGKVTVSLRFDLRCCTIGADSSTLLPPRTSLTRKVNESTRSLPLSADHPYSTAGIPSCLSPVSARAVMSQAPCDAPAAKKCGSAVGNVRKAHGFIISLTAIPDDRLIRQTTLLAIVTKIASLIVVTC